MEIIETCRHRMLGLGRLEPLFGKPISMSTAIRIERIGKRKQQRYTLWLPSPLHVSYFLANRNRLNVWTIETSQEVIGSFFFYSSGSDDFLANRTIQLEYNIRCLGDTKKSESKRNRWNILCSLLLWKVRHFSVASGVSCLPHFLVEKFSCTRLSDEFWSSRANSSLLV